MTHERAPYGRGPGARDWGPGAGTQNSSVTPGPQPPIPTYYDRPAIKSSYYGWLIASYVFVGGIAGAAQVIATIVDLLSGRRDRVIVSAGRYLALAGSLISPVLLIQDLHTPARWYNMLRIVRTSSAMSIGSWTLAVFGTTSGVAAAAQALGDLFGLRAGHTLARLFGLPAAAAGTVMSVYTGSLLAATSVPMWAAVERRLPALFGASAFATATAAMALVGEFASARPDTRRRLRRLSLAASAAQLLLATLAERQWQRRSVSAPLDQQPLQTVYRLGVTGLGMVAPLAIHGLQTLTGRESARLTTVAAIATLAGGFAERAVLVFAGNQSAGRARDYLQFTQPSNKP